MRWAVYSLLLFVTLLGTQAQAQWANSWVTPKNLWKVVVVIHDNAENGCWTNLGETRTYAEDKLREAGFDVISRESTDAEWAAFFTVNVSATRPQGTCYGGVNVDLSVWSRPLRNSDRFVTLASVAGAGVNFTGQQNANTITLSQVGALIEKISEQKSEVSD